MYFEIYKHQSSHVPGLIDTPKPAEWRWRLKSNNNETIASGEGYANKRDCYRAIELVKGVNSSTGIVERDM